MGDRANIYLIDGDDVARGMYLYTHWSGREWPEKLREALEFGESRWGDAQYLPRIIASRVFADLVDSDTGGGLSTTMWDNEYDVIVVNIPTRRVAFASPGQESQPNAWFEIQTFEDFIKAIPASYPKE